MSAKVRRLSGPAGKHRGYTFVCPGCTVWAKCRGASDAYQAWHVFHTEAWTIDGKAGPMWSFDGSTERPTFEPSLLIYRGTHPDGEIAHPRCHLFVQQGQIQFCSDSEHALAGKTVAMVVVG